MFRVLEHYGGDFEVLLTFTDLALSQREGTNGDHDLLDCID